MDLGYGNRQMKAVPSFHQELLRTSRALWQGSGGQNVDIRVLAIRTWFLTGVTFHTLIEKSFATQVVIDSDDIRWTWIVEKPGKLVLCNAYPLKPVPHWTIRGESAGEQVKGNPAALVFELSLLGKFWCAVGLAKVIGLDETRVRVDGADGTHRENNGTTLPHQGTGKPDIVAPVRIPVSIQGGESGGG
jgi:hypothetical protein